MPVIKKVLIQKVSDNNSRAISNKVNKERLHKLGLRSQKQGRITIKPETVVAHNGYAPSFFILQYFLNGLADVLNPLGAFTQKN